MPTKSKVFKRNDTITLRMNTRIVGRVVRRVNIFQVEVIDVAGRIYLLEDHQVDRIEEYRRMTRADLARRTQSQRTWIRKYWQPIDSIRKLKQRASKNYPNIWKKRGSLYHYESVSI